MFNLFTELKDPKKKDAKIADAYTPINFDTQIIHGLTFIKDGAKYNEKKEFKSGQDGGAKKGEPEPEVPLPAYLYSLFVLIPVVLVAIALGLATNNNYQLLFNFFVFVLACFIGYMVIWGVSPSLHTPLMSVTNAISGIIVIGCMLQLTSAPFFVDYSVCGFIGVFFASINIFGGFVVTQKMINMFLSDEPEPKSHGHHWGR